MPAETESGPLLQQRLLHILALFRKRIYSQGDLPFARPRPYRKRSRKRSAANDTSVEKQIRPAIPPGLMMEDRFGTPANSLIEVLRVQARIVGWNEFSFLGEGLTWKLSPIFLTFHQKNRQNLGISHI